MARERQMYSIHSAGMPVETETVAPQSANPVGAEVAERDDTDEMLYLLGRSSLK